VFLLAGCASAFDNAKDAADVPIPIIDTLKPSFEWDRPKVKDATFDVIVALGVDKGNGVWQPGKVVFYRQGLSETKVTVDKPLNPDTVYVASVRTRQGRQTSAWAPYSDPDGKAHYNIISRFRTPKS
jgi:hypothetical protein